MKCPNCGALITIGGKRLDPLGTQTEVEAYAHAMNDEVKCWRCGWTARPHRKPSDRPRLKMNPKNLQSLRPMSAFDHYISTGTLADIYKPVRGRKVDEGL